MTSYNQLFFRSLHHADGRDWMRLHTISWMLTRRVRSRVEDSAPHSEADLDQAAADPAALAHIVSVSGRSSGAAPEGPAALARTSTLAREIVVRQTRLLVYSQCFGTGGSHDRAKESETQEGQSELAEREA